MRLSYTIWFTGVCLFISQLCYAQKLQLSPEEYMDANQRYVKVIGTVEDKTACFVENFEGYRILWYDSAMRKIATSKLDFLDRGADGLRFHVKEGVIQVFYQKKKRKRRTLWAARVVPLDKDTIVPVLLDSIELKNAWDQQRYDIYSSGNDKRTVYSTITYDNKNDILKFEVVSLNSELNPIQRVSESLNDVPFHVLIDVAVDNQDGMHLFFGEPSKLAGRWNKLLVGSKITSQAELRYRKLDLQNKLLGGPRFVRSDINNSVHVAGLLYDKASQQILYLGHYKYDWSNQIWQDPTLTKVADLNWDQNSKLDEVQLRNFLLKQDGGYAFILENSYEERHQRNRNMGMMSSGVVLGGGSYSVYHDDEIHAVSMKPNGAIDWYEVVLKNQETSDANGRFQSFGMLEYPLGNVFLFNDKQNGSKRFITAFLSNTGALKLRQFSSAQYELLEQDNMLLRSAKQVASNELVFPIIKRGTLSFAKIIF